VSRAIELLMKEHQDIERVLDVMSDVVVGAAEGQALDLPLLAKVAGFIQTFADDLHHAKEEKILFPAMVAHGVPLDRGPLACMLAEHELGRQHARRFRMAIAEVSVGNMEMRPVLFDAAAQYEGLLRAHIEKEDGFLYGLALRVLPPSSLLAMEATFAESDGALVGALTATADTLQHARFEPRTMHP
jgi:hemerythrin-like domain-containing protein